MDRDKNMPNNPIHASLVEEEARESKDKTSNGSPRFSPDTKVHDKNPSAKHHSFSKPATVSPVNSDEPDIFIPGAYPMDDNGHSKKVRDIDSQLPSKEIPSGSKVGVGSLPGNFNEPGVATLPEERIDGRPYGSGHTGFEETLGNRTTFVQNNSPSKSKAAPHELSELGKVPSVETHLENDQHKTASYASQHPLSESSNVSSQPGADTVKSMAGKVGRSLPGLAQGTGNALSAAMYAGSQVLGTVEGATVDAIPKVRQETGGAFNAAVHAGGTVLGSMEKATVDAMHGAEHMLSDIGEGAKSYMPNVGAYFGVEQKQTQAQNDAKAKQPFKPRPPLISSNSSGSFVTSGVDVPNSRSRSRLDLAHSDTSSVFLNSGLATPSSMDSEMTDSSQPCKLPNVIKKEYSRSVEYDLDGEEINTETFLYENDFSSSDTEGGIHHAHEPHHHHHHPHHHKHDSGAPSIPRHGTVEHGDDIVEGVGGVTYHRFAKDGKLPGFPTEAGMKQLISDRMKEDKKREATSGVPSLRVTDYGLPSSTRRTNEDSDLSSQPDWTDSELEDRNVEERKEVPIFINGATTASGKFEAVFQSISDEPDTTQTMHSVREKKSTPTGNIKSSLNPQAPPFIAHSTRGVSGQKMAPGYLGKPVSEAEINSEVEQARREIDRKLGVN